LLNVSHDLRAPLDAALGEKQRSGAAGSARVTRIAGGDGWDIFDILCTRGTQDESFEEQHAATSVSLVLAGSFDYRSAAGRAVLAPGAMLLGRAGTCFTCCHEHTSGDRCLSFQFAPSLIDDGRRHAPGACDFAGVSLPPSTATASLFAKATVLLDFHGDGETLALDVLDTAFSAPAGHCSPCLAAEGRVRRAARRIEAEFTEPLGLAQLAEGSGLSRFNFLRQYKAVMGITPHQHVLRLRLQAAARMLRTSSATVTQVALETGFSDLSNFIRSFRAEFGTSPKRWRRANASGDAVVRRMIRDIRKGQDL
jgi:AraC-like DNA-binding protein